MARASVVSMATGSGNSAGNRQVGSRQFHVEMAVVTSDNLIANVSYFIMMSFMRKLPAHTMPTKNGVEETFIKIQ